MRVGCGVSRGVTARCLKLALNSVSLWSCHPKGGLCGTHNQRQPLWSLPCLIEAVFPSGSIPGP